MVWRSRPHVEYFLQAVSRWYDLVIFTASLPQYAVPIVEALDRGRGLFKHIYFRQVRP